MIFYTEDNYASLAQWLEHRICNARVVGSNPTGGLLFRFFLYLLSR